MVVTSKSTRFASTAKSIAITSNEDFEMGLDLEPTFREMTQRRILRTYGGVIAPHSRAFLILVSFALLALGFVNVSVANSNAELAANETASSSGRSVAISISSWNLSVGENFALFVLAATVLFLAMQIMEVVRTTIYWLVTGLLAFVVLQFACPPGTCEQFGLVSLAIQISTSK